MNWFAYNWPRLGTLLLVGAVGWWGIRFVLSKLRGALAAREAQFGRLDPRVHTLVGVARHVLVTLLLLVIAVLVLAELNVDISAFWGAAGIAGVALGLATQGLAKDIIRGLSLLVSNEVTVGDKVEIAGRLGVVEEVMVRRITLRDDSGAVHFVPCGAIGTVTNHSRDFSYAVLEIRVAQSTDIGRAIQAIRDVTQVLRAESDYATVILGPVEGLGFDRWTDWSIVLKAKVKVAVGKDSEVRHELFRRILARFEREGISYPQHSMSEPQASSAHESARGTVGA